MNEKDFYNDVSHVFLKHDPLDIHFDENADEYGPELKDLVPQLKMCRSEKDVALLVGKIFTGWFGEASLQNLKSKYEMISTDLAKVWSTYVQQN